MPASPNGFLSVKLPDALQALKMRVLAASTNGVLQADIRTIVEENRQQAVQRAAA